MFVSNDQTVIRKERNHNISSGKIEQEYESRSTFDDDGLGEERVTGEDVKDRENREFIHRYHRQKTNLEISTSHHNLDDDTTRLECQICLADFQVGEQICWSNNPECVHTFHIACLEPWLMNHDECPLCRNPYLVRPKKSPVAEVEVNDFEQEVITRSNMTPITHHVVTALSLFAPRQHNRDSASHDNPNEENASDPEACRAGAPIDQMPTEEATNEVNSDVEPQITIEEPIR